jgi:GNAT superfamily N-acetyltransferase
MAVIDRYRSEDRRAVSTLYRRVFGHDAAEANQLRWDWQYRRNPNNPPDGPQIWVAREGPTVIGQYATMPVRLTVRGTEIEGSWGMDVMVAPERQRQGLGEVLFRTWDQHVGASLGLGLSEASYQLFKKLRWPNAGPVPCLVKPLSRRAFRRANWPMPINRLVSALTLPLVRVIARTRPLAAQVESIRRFDGSFTSLWERIGGKFDFAVRRDAAYLNWKYIEPPHVRYNVVALRRDREVIGYAVYRHVQEPRGRVTMLVDFLVDPDDAAGITTLLRWVDRDARAAHSDKIRAFALHAGYRREMRRAGYFQVKSTMEFALKVNSVDVPAEFYQHHDKWHVTLGDSDQDR